MSVQTTNTTASVRAPGDDYDVTNICVTCGRIKADTLNALFVTHRPRLGARDIRKLYRRASVVLARYDDLDSAIKKRTEPHK